jgi:hypothetical protein
MARSIPVLKKQRLAYLAALLRDTAESCSLSTTLNDDEFRGQARAWLEARAWFQALEREVEELLSEETVAKHQNLGGSVWELD